MKSRLGVLVIHGFTAHISCVETLAHYFDNERLPYEMPVLPGHSEECPSALIGKSWKDWIEHCSKSLKKLLDRCDKAIIVGHSMGALIAINLQVDNKSTIDSLVLVAPALILKNPLAPRNKLHFITTPLSLFYKTWTLKQNILDSNKNYKWVPVESIVTFFSLIKETYKVLNQVSSPILVIQSKADRVVPNVSGEYILDNINSSSSDKKLVYFFASEHEMLRGAQKEAVSHEILAYIKSRN
ncbi:alpha/beta hydrolase [Alteromonas gilva]|uniref:Alpha/beta fold hydrolase n=1 Tax=Alteromonas gilva TaxID=2987522 RepID=A0ABT5L639_9ALTE|nr:alpha/beta fold hydrolase [Alteromonas gilva]MDC8832499.1 alpha/beta fold hydrolase [Alteromonas gilva]